METLLEYEAKLAANVAVDGTHTSSVMVALKPPSRGSIYLQSGDIADGPIINPNYFATEVDRQHIIAGETPPPGFSPVTTNSTDERLAVFRRGFAPLATAAHTQAPVYGLAEHAAAIISGHF
ncbi:hypothetical protein DL770_000191 [Monosporascus sp. CRB-9-2]|nr:hypothetical protein DL770_000191 [Monosporascus sp. CRB-9-2]